MNEEIILIIIITVLVFCNKFFVHSCIRERYKLLAQIGTKKEPVQNPIVTKPKPLPYQGKYSDDKAKRLRVGRDYGEKTN